MRETRSSGSAEGVIGNSDPYSDSSEPAVVDKLQSTRSEEPTLLCNQVPVTGKTRTEPHPLVIELIRPDS
jgi:hypothetical protein